MKSQQSLLIGFTAGASSEHLTKEMTMAEPLSVARWLLASILRSRRRVGNSKTGLSKPMVRGKRGRSRLVEKLKLHPLLGVLCSGLPLPGYCETVTLPFASVQALSGTVHKNFKTMIAPGNALYKNFSSPGLPSKWKKPAGAVYLGANGDQGAFWMHNNAAESPNGYLFKGSFMIGYEGLAVATDATLFISKPMNWSGSLAAWRLYYIKNTDGTLALFFFVGWDSVTNNQSAALYKLPVVTNQAYDVVIRYDTAHRIYSLSLDGELKIRQQMPADYPLIGTQIVGSSGSADGHDTEFMVDNVSWTELPGLTAAEAKAVK